MIYLLIPTILIYCTLGVYLLSRYRDNTKARSLGYFALFSTLGVAGVLIQGTTKMEELAILGALLAVGGGMIGIAVGLLMLIIGLFYPHLLMARRRVLHYGLLGLGGLLAGVAFVSAIERPFVERVDGMYRISQANPAFQIGVVTAGVCLPLALLILIHRIWWSRVDRDFATTLLLSLLVGIASSRTSGAFPVEAQLVLNAITFLPASLAILFLLLRRRLFTLRQVGIERAVDSSSDQMLVVDALGAISWCNRAVLQVFRARRQKQIGRPMVEVLPALVPGAQRVLADAILANRSTIDVFTVDCTDERSRRITIQPIAHRVGQHEGWLILIQDVTELKQAEDMRQRYQQQLEQEVGARTEALTQANARLHELAAELGEKNDNFAKDRALARDIQLGLLPTSAPWDSKLLASHACSIPAAEVGGDFYTYIGFRESMAAVAVGDISGKGVGAALMMALVSSTIEARARDHDSPDHLLAHLNDELVARLRTNRMNAAVVLAVLDFKRRQLTVANAGMIVPFLLRDGAAAMLDVAGMPLGIQPAARYTPLTIPVQPADRLIFVSDGIVEARSPAGELFGFERVQETLIAAPAALDRAVQHLMDEAQRFMAGAAQADDMTVVGLEIKEFA